MRIDWDQLCRNPQEYEDLVKLLLQRLHPDGQVVDGRGGDGGREFQVASESSLALFEAKSFSGRLGNSQRGQVRRSLLSAARHQPDSWDLIVPIDPTPAELRWFARLRGDEFSFMARWLGRSWLDEQLAAHEDLVRSNQTVRDELLELAGRYKMEKEALAGGVSDLLDRHRALKELGDTLSPHWRPVIGQLSDGTPVVTLQAKHPDAAKKAPVSFRLTAAFPTDSADPTLQTLHAQIRSSINYGTGVEIPGEYVSEFAASGPPGLGLPSPDSVIERVVLVELPETKDLPTQSIAAYAPGAAFPIASLDFQTIRRTTGQAGSRLVAFDFSRCLQLVTQSTRDGEVGIQLRGQEQDSVLPTALLPAIRLVQAMQLPNSVRLTMRHDDRLTVHDIELQPDPSIEDLPDEFVNYLEDLAAIQNALHQPFLISTSITQQEIDVAARLRRLINGESVPWLRGPVTITLDPTNIAQFKSEFPASGGLLRVSRDNVEVRFGDHILHTGPMFMIGSVTLDLDAIPDKASAEHEVTTTVEVGGDGWFHAQRGIPDDLKESEGELPPSAHGRVSYAPIHHDASGTAEPAPP